VCCYDHHLAHCIVMSTAQSTPTSPTTQRVKSVPRVLSSPLRPTSPQSSSTVIPSNSRRPSLGVGQTPHAKTPPSLAKSRARDLLRKHYGLGVGPPPPLPGRSDDPMDLGMLFGKLSNPILIMLPKIQQLLTQNHTMNNL
jgi:hypothetical protein